MSDNITMVFIMSYWLGLGLGLGGLYYHIQFLFIFDQCSVDDIYETILIPKHL